MDNTDYKILSLLQNDAKISNSEIARQIGMVPSGVLERIRKLEESGIISEYNTRLNAESLNLGLLAFVFVRSEEPPGSLRVYDEFRKMPEILEIHNVAGEDCYLLKIRLKDNKQLAVFLREKIGVIKAVTSTRTVIVLETLKESCNIALPESE